MSSCQVCYDGLTLSPHETWVQHIQLHLAHRTCGPDDLTYLQACPLRRHAVVPFEFPRQVSRCPRGNALNLSFLRKGSTNRRSGARGPDLNRQSQRCKTPTVDLILGGTCSVWSENLSVRAAG